MYRYLITSLFLFVGCQYFSWGQCDIWEKCVIHNPGFEDGDPQPTYPGRDFEYIEVWESRTNQSGTAFHHSPDWFNFPNFPCFNVPPFEGTHYIGMSDYELAQQKFFVQNEFIEGAAYLLKANIYLASTFYWTGTADFDFSDMKFYVARKQIKYIEENIDQSNHCSDEYKNHLDQSGQNIIEIYSLDLSILPLNEWIELVIEVPQAPPAGYNWFAMEIRNKNNSLSYNCNRSYVLIDEVTLIPGCINGCSSTAGLKSVCGSNNINSVSPFYLWGLKDITHVDFHIYNDIREYLGLAFSIDNPQEKIAWDGRLMNGVNLPPASYLYRVELTNDCGTVMTDYTLLSGKRGQIDHLSAN